LKIVIYCRELQLSVRPQFVGRLPGVVSHDGRECEQRTFIAALHFLDARLDLTLQKLGTDHGGAIRLAGLITLGLRAHVLREALPLRFAEGAKRIIVKRGVKRDARSMELPDDGDVQPLLGEQNLDVASAPGSGNRRIEQWLGEKAARKRKRPHGGFIGSVATLNPCHALDFEIGQRNGAEDQAATGRLFERDARLRDLRIFLERRGKSRIEGDGVNGRRGDDQSDRGDGEAL
jgi:hypothetical protein